MIELEIYKKSDFYEDYISSQKEYYERENADAYFAERLAEKDKEIALLKERICNGDVSRATWIDDCFDKDKEIAELKEKLRDHCIHCPVKEQEDDVVADLKAKLAEKESWVKMLGEGEKTLSLELEKTKKKLENVQASMYADVVDANMENRRLKRALWFERARRAEARKDYWYARSCHEGDDFLVSIDGSPVKYIGCIKRTNFEWLKIWSEIECKCRAKAEEYGEGK